MSRRDRDARERHRSGFDRLPSPNSSRREGKAEDEREGINSVVSDGGDSKKRRLQDAAVPLQESAAVNDNKIHPTDLPRSRSYFQHDERGNVRQVRRDFDRRATDEYQGRNSNRDGASVTKKYRTDDLGRKEERLQAKGDNRDVWKHDGFYKMEAEPAQPQRKRPAFREKKIPFESENTDKATTKSIMPGHSEYPISESDRRQERDRSRHLDRSGRFAPADAIEAQTRGFPSRERYPAGNNNHRGRDRFNGKQGYRVSDQRGGKWKHDLFDEADKSPSRKNEDDQIAKVEALLAS